MRGFVAGLALALLIVTPASAVGNDSATIAAEVVGADVTYHVTVHNVRNPYDVWVGQRCYLADELVDAQYQGVGAGWTAITPAKGNKFDAAGSVGGFTTSGIHHGDETVGDTPWSSDRCEAWVWYWPDLDPLSSVLAFSVS